MTSWLEMNDRCIRRPLCANMYSSAGFGFSPEIKILVAMYVALGVHSSGFVYARTSCQFFSFGRTLKALGIFPDLYRLSNTPTLSAFSGPFRNLNQGGGGAGQMYFVYTSVIFSSTLSTLGLAATRINSLVIKYSLDFYHPRHFAAWQRHPLTATRA